MPKGTLRGTGGDSAILSPPVTTHTPPPAGLYLITPDSISDRDELLARVSHALDGGASLLQFRDKSASRKEKRKRAEALMSLCADRGIALIINDDPVLATGIGAFGVHLGRDDPDPAAVRRNHPDLYLGVSCYNELSLARTLAPSADYLAFGSFFPSTTKPDAVAASISLLRQAASFELPVAAIGGIRADSGAPLVEAGARWLAVCGAVFDATDIARASAELNQLFSAGNAPAASP